MNEATLRRRHRKLGVILAVLLGVQAATGLFLSLGDLLEKPDTPATETDGDAAFLEVLHRGGGTAGNVYRVFLGTAVLGQIALGGLISLKIRERATRP